MLPPNVFRFGADMVRPLIAAEYPQARSHRDLDVVARLRPGVTPARAQAALDTIAGRLAHDYPATNARHGFRVEQQDSRFYRFQRRLHRRQSLQWIARRAHEQRGPVGGLAFERMIGPFLHGSLADPHKQVIAGIIFFAVVTGAYTIYGGLRSAAWTDFMQIIILGIGVFTLDTGLLFVVHLRMTGKLLLRGAEDPPDAFLRAVLSLEDGLELRFTDVRKFGGFWLVEDLSQVTPDLGPEPFDEGFTAEVIRAAVANRKAPVKSIILDQRRIAGIGNSESATY